MIQVDPLKERVQTLLARVAVKSTSRWAVKEKAPGVILLQYGELTRHVFTHALVEQYGRKFYVSPHMTDGEILQTALLAAIQFAEHETREAFLFDGVRLFGPHKSVAALMHATEETRAHGQ